MSSEEKLAELEEYRKGKGLAANPQLEQAMAVLTMLLEPLNLKWLAGGSVGLWLQGIWLNAPPRDIDIYAEPDSAAKIHQQLKAFAVDEPHWDRSGIYASLLSHYKIQDYTLELVGGFEVHAPLAAYKVEIEEVLEPEAVQVIEGLKVMPLAHEYIFNLLRERPDRYETIAAHMNAEPGRSISLLKRMAVRNRWSEAQQAEMNRLAFLKGWLIGEN